MYSIYCQLIGNFFLANLIKFFIRINYSLIEKSFLIIITIVSGSSSKSDIYSVFYTPIFLISHVLVS